MNLIDLSCKFRLLRREGFEPGYAFDDGGRRKAGYRRDTGDCVVRATCIVLGLDYETTLASFRKITLEGIRSLRSWEASLTERESKGTEGVGSITRFERKMISNSDFGVPTGIAHNALGDLGFSYVKTWRKGLFISNYGDHVNRGILPAEGSMILRFRGHVSAVINGDIRDTFDTRGFVVRGAFLMNIH